APSRLALLRSTWLRSTFRRSRLRRSSGVSASCSTSIIEKASDVRFLTVVSIAAAPFPTPVAFSGSPCRPADPEVTAWRSLKDCDGRRKYFVHERRRQGLHLSAVASGEIEYARLVTADDARGLGAIQRHGKADAPGELAAICDWKNDRK